MRILIVCESCNSADVVERSVRYNLQFCDALIVVDRGSVDGSREILADLVREHLPIVVFDDPEFAKGVENRRRRVCVNAYRHFRPDYILLVDADEALSLANRSALEAELRRVGNSQRLLVACRTVAGGSDEEDSEGQCLGAHDERSSVLGERWEERLLTRRGLSRWNDEGLGIAQPEDHRSDRRLSSVSLQIAVSREREREDTVDDASAEPAGGSHRRALLHGNVPEQRDVRESGALGAVYHQENLYLDLPPFRYMWEVDRPSTVLDLGCGLGGYVRAFSDWGTRRVVGVDDFEESAEFLCEGAYVRRDLREPVDLGDRFELVICTEVLEHIDAQFEDAALESIARHAAGQILFSAARPGQPGVGHVNCRPPEYWLERWVDLGWEVDPFASLAVRSLATFYWFRRNLLVLKRAGQASPRGDFSVEDLRSFEAEKIPWRGEAPWQHRFPLAVELPGEEHVVGARES